MEAVPLSTDDILSSIKPFGKIQMLFLISGAYCYFFMPMNGQSVNFLAAMPDHHCAPREGYSLNESIPYTTDEDGQRVYDQCTEYVNPDYRNDTQSCQNGWEYADDVYGETIITEWDLVCEQNNGASEISQSVVMLGGLFGAFSFGSLADRYGRRPTFLFALVLYDVSGLVLCLSTNYTMFIVLRFFTGFSQVAFWVPLSSNLSEYMIPKYRSRAMTVPSIALSVGLMFMALLAFLIRDWRYLQLAITSPMILATFAFWFLPESLRWLMSRGKDEQAKHLVRRLSKINGIEIPEGGTYDVAYDVTTARNGQVYTISGSGRTNPPVRDVESELKEKSEYILEDIEKSFTEKPVSGTEIRGIEGEVDREDPFGLVDEKSSAGTSKKVSRKSYLHLFKPPVLHVTVVLSILRFSHTLVYFGFALSTGRLAGNPYLNFFFSALVELPARVIAPLVYRKFRRTHLLSFCFGVCCADLIALVLVPLETKNGADLGALRNTLSLVGKFFVTLTLSGHMLLIMELFPTEMRNMGNGWTLCIGRIGAIIAPFMLYLDNSVENFSAILMAAFSFLTAVIILSLPDTRKTEQPQTTQDLRDIMRSEKTKKQKRRMDEKEETEENGATNEAFEQDGEE